MIRGKWHRISIYRRLIITFLLVIVPIVALCLYIVELATENLKEEISVSMRSNVHFYLNSFETEIDRLVQLKKEYVLDDDLADLSTIAPYMTNYEKRVAILRLQRKLSLLKAASVYVQEVKVTIPLIERSVYPNGFNEEHLSEEEIKALRNPTDLGGSPLLFWKDHVYLTQPSRNVKEGNPAFLLRMAFSKEKLVHSLDQIGNFKDSGAILLHPREGWAIAGEQHPEVLSFLRTEFVVPSAADRQTSIRIGDRMYLITQDYSKALGVYLIAYVPEEQFFASLNFYKNMLWALSLSSFLLILFFSYRIYRLIQLPLNHLSRAFRKMENGDLNFSLTYRFHDEFGYLFERFNEMTMNLKNLIQEVYEQKIRSQRSELKQLQSQIHPHFLYNSLFVLYRMAKLHDIDHVIRFTEHLTQYFQFMTRTAEDEVDLEMEANHAKAYVEIQTTRFRSSISAEFGQLPLGTEQWKIPRLTLQPIIENSFKYALEQKIRDGRLIVRFRKTSVLLTITVEDNGENLTDSDIMKMNRDIQLSDPEGETTGLLNVHRRLQLKFGPDSGLKFIRSSLGGLQVDLHIPKEGRT